MGKWLDAVRQKSEMGGGTHPTKPTKAPSVGFVSAPPPGNPEKEGEAAASFVGSVSAPSGPFGKNEPEAPCPECNCAGWWQDRAGGWWCERCRRFEPGQWARLVTLPEGERPEPPEPTDEDVAAALELATKYGWTEEALAVAFGVAWPGIATEPRTLQAALKNLLPHPNLGGLACRSCGDHAAIPDRPLEPIRCPGCGARLAGPAVSIKIEPDRSSCSTCGGQEFRADLWGVLRCQRCRPLLPGADDV